MRSGEGSCDGSHPSAGRVATEVSFSIRGERGSIDVLAFHPATATLLVIEVKSLVPDVQATFVTPDRKTRLASEIARGRGWRPSRLGRLLVVVGPRVSRVQDTTAPNARLVR